MGGIISKKNIFIKNKNNNNNNKKKDDNKNNKEECSICMEYTNLVHAFPCNHSACISCFISFSKYSEYNNLCCHICREPINFLKINNIQLKKLILKPKKLCDNYDNSIDKGGLKKLQYNTIERIKSMKSTHKLYTIKIDKMYISGCSICGIVYDDNVIDPYGPNFLMECTGVNHGTNPNTRILLCSKMLEGFITKHMNKYNKLYKIKKKDYEVNNEFNKTKFSYIDNIVNENIVFV